MNAVETIQLAMRHHQAGELEQAEAMYRQALAQSPDHPDALHLLGALAGQQGRLEEAIELIGRAITLNPKQAVYFCNLSEMYRRAGRTEEAIASARKAIAADARYAKAYCIMGAALTFVRRFDDAVAAFRRAIELKPDFLEAYLNLGRTFNSLGQFEDAKGVFRRGLQIQPDSIEALCGLGLALRESGRAGEAIPLLRRAIEIQPAGSEAYSNLGIALSQEDRLEEAIAAFRRAVEVQPDSAAAVKNLGVALAENGQFDDSLKTLERAIELKPDMPEAHGNRALMLLVKGDFDRGWREYEWRWRAQLSMVSEAREFTQPKWEGGPLEGQTILIYAEQGFGDTLQFVRYLPMVAQRGGRVVLECQRELVRLLGRMPGPHRIVAAGEALPGFHCRCPLLSLPLAFNTKIDSIPAEIPYLSADASLAARWKSRVDSLPAGLRVGLVWAGSPKNKLDRKRSIAAEQLSPLASVPEVQWVSLQKGTSVKNPLPAGASYVDWTDELRDFEDTAALIANLDLVITVDTAVAHLAGAMGKPVWIMIAYVPDWRWMLKREDSPWYPSVRLFRQKALRDWAGVIGEVREELGKTRGRGSAAK